MSYQERALVGLAPVAAAGVYAAGAGGLVLLLSGLFGAVTGELTVRRLRGLEPGGPPISALLAGLVVVLLLPVSTPPWVALLGGLFASGVVEGAFGGRGNAVFHPGVTGWLFLTMAWGGYTVVSGAGAGPGLDRLVLNPDAARMVEVSPLMVTIGGLLPLARNPSLAWGSAGILPVLLVGPWAGVEVAPSAGAVALFGLFAVTDPDYSPGSRYGRLLFGAGCGGLALLYGSRGGLLEGLVLSVVLMNAISPWIDRLLPAGVEVEGGEPGVEG